MSEIFTKGNCDLCELVQRKMMALIMLPSVEPLLVDMDIKVSAVNHRQRRMLKRQIYVRLGGGR